MKRPTDTRTQTQPQPARTSRPNPQTHLDPEVIRARAYHLYLTSGCPQNCAEQHWYQAEQELLSEKNLKRR